jgi:atypical dual specificity phosphatase
VINMCEEYEGPYKKYKELGITSLHLPTVDHFEPSIADLEEAIHFIDGFQRAGSKVYVHCRAGHGRSAAVTLAWLLSKDPSSNLKELNDELSTLRNVRKTLWQQPNIIRLRDRLKQQKGLEIDEIADTKRK